MLRYLILSLFVGCVIAEGITWVEQPIKEGEVMHCVDQNGDSHDVGSRWQLEGECAVFSCLHLPIQGNSVVLLRTPTDCNKEARRFTIIPPYVS